MSSRPRRPATPHLEAGPPDSPLAPLGIDAVSERAYRAVLRHPGETLEVLCLSTGRSLDDLRQDLDPLVARALVRVVDNTVVPEPPSFALRRIVSREARRVADRARALELVESELQQYVNEHQVAQRDDWHSTPLDVIPAAQVVDVMETLLNTTAGELLFMRPDQWYLPAGLEIDGRVAAAIRGGRASRSLYPVTLLDRPRQESVEQRVRAGERARLLPAVPSRLAVFGDDAVVLPQQWGQPMGPLLLVREPAVVAACRTLFDQLWTRATMVPGLDHEPGRGGRKELLELLELLARGAKDEQISRTLGTSLRTVRRRVAQLMGELGVDTRFQLGMEAVRRGWL